MSTLSISFGGRLQVELQLNVVKMQAMFVLPRAHSLPPNLQIYYGDRAMDIVSSYKYLGVYIDDGLTWKQHINHVIRKVLQNIFALRTSGPQLTLTSQRTYYRKRESASYIVREVLSVRKREREREIQRERERERERETEVT